MKAPRAARAWACVLTLLPGVPCVAADPQAVTYSTYAMTGVAFDDPPGGLAGIEQRITVNEHFALSAVLAYLDVRNTIHEPQFRVVATGTVALEDWTLENRQLISLGEVSNARYRNRLRVMRAGLFDRQALSLRAFDELYVDLDGVRVLRNDLALGIGLQLNRRCGVELYHVWVDGPNGFSTNYALVMFMLKMD